MNEIEKEIEEMAKDVANIHRRFLEDENFEILDDYIAEKLINAGYRNIKDKVVLSKEEYQNDFSSQFNKGYEKGSKETAREILTKVKQALNYLDNEWEISNALYQIEKQYGVEVE